jgi:acyl-CoA thioester hydrolase
MSATRDEFPYGVTITTRWMDHDAHGHVNNVHYYSYFDTAVTTWLINEAGHDVRSADVLGLCVESRCEFLAPLTFPDVIEARVRVGRVGRSSVRYEVGLFTGERHVAAATGHFVHVYVGRDERRPTVIPSGLRAALQGLESAPLSTTTAPPR